MSPSKRNGGSAGQSSLPLAANAGRVAMAIPSAPPITPPDLLRKFRLETIDPRSNPQCYIVTKLPREAAMDVNATIPWAMVPAAPG